MNDDFYIGWSENAPASFIKMRRNFFLCSIILLLVVAIVFTLSEQKFRDSYYEYGILQEVSGYLVKEPVWGLRTMEEGAIKTIPLVGFGKMGPEKTLANMMVDHNLEEGTMVTLRGMIFHYQGKRWMELTEGENSLVESGVKMNLDRDIVRIGNRKLTGEIVDPKCFFGVMNPASKAIHRSCAIRCISGGVPPILAIRENGEFIDYYFVHGENMKSVADDILPFVGIPVSISGSVSTYDDWKLLEINSSDISLAKRDKGQRAYTVAICN